MAKSIRSKRKRKLRAQRREKLKPKVKAQLEKILGLSDKEMITDTQEEEDNNSEEETLENEDTKNNTTTTGKSDKTESKRVLNRLKLCGKSENCCALFKIFH